MDILHDLKTKTSPEAFHHTQACLTQQIAGLFDPEAHEFNGVKSSDNLDRVCAVYGEEYRPKLLTLYGESVVCDDGPEGHAQAVALAERLFA